MSPPKLSVPAAASAICQRLSEQGHGAWVVGGCVRDSLRALGVAGEQAPLLSTDWDIATSARPAQVQKLFRHVIPTGIEHGTVTVIIDKVHYEVTTLRADVGYSDGRRPDRVEFVDDIVADLARRDFTVNAIAYDVRNDTLIDPFGGIDDLGRKLLRAVGDPAQRFAEDGLRVLRAARFVATLEFTLDPATESAILPSLASYRKVSAERIRDEWLKSLKARRPSLAFAVMRDHGLLEASAPALWALHDASVEGANLLDRCLRCLDLAPKGVALQLAALLHALAPEPVAAAQRAVELLQQLRCSNDEQQRVRGLIQQHDPGYVSAWSDADVRHWLSRVGPALYTDTLTLAALVREAAGDDTRPIGDLRARAEAEMMQGVALSLRDLAVSGRDLMSALELEPGPHLGTLLERLLSEVLDDPALNEKQRLLERAAQIAKGP